MDRINNFIKTAGWSRIIIALFLLVLFIMAPFFDIRLDFAFDFVFNRFCMNAIMVLSLIFMIQSGCGLNFGITLGLLAGIFGATCSLELELTGFPGIFAAMGIGIIVAAGFGYIYGKILNRVKGDEMIVSTYVGLSVVAFLNIMWTVLPFKNPTIIWGYGGSGIRHTVSVEGYWLNQLSGFLNIEITKYFSLQLGLLIFFALACFLVWAFFKTKTGAAMIAVGSNPDYARAAGINVDRIRTLSVILSTCVAAVGVIVHQQSYGFIMYYNAPNNFTFPTIAAILIGGASIKKASILNVIIGTFLFQGIITMAPLVINGIFQMDIAEVFRLIISNGMILYALTRKER